MQVAVTAWKFGTRGLAQELASQAELAESIGFDSFWLPESHFAGTSSIPSPLMLLAAVASRTSNIRLGTTSYLLPIRHPIQAAEEVAVLDTMSDGRVILGVGRGYMDSMFSAFDIPVKDKRNRFKANLALMISAWKGEPVASDQQGEPIYLSPLPVQKPHPPIWVAAFGPLAIKQAGSLGLPYIASPRETLDVLAANYEQHAMHASEAGHKPIETRPVMRTVLISEHPALIREVRTRLTTDTGSNAEEHSIVGDTAYAADRIAQYREQLGMNYLIARGRIPGIDQADQVASHEALARLTR